MRGGKLLGDVRHVGAHELQVAAHHRIEGAERGGARFRRGALAQVEFHRFEELVAELVPEEFIQALGDLAEAVFGITFLQVRGQRVELGHDVEVIGRQVGRGHPISAL